MSNRYLARGIVLSAAMLAADVLLSGLAVAADTTPLAAKVDAFSVPHGANYVAISLKPNDVAATATPRDIVVMFNTSASQTGEARTKGIQALKALLATLPAGDRVRLLAVDLDATPLTKTFVSTNSKEMTDALAALDLRTPLGATDMGKAMGAVLESFAGQTGRSRAAIYIGDGRSRANLIGTEDFRSISGRLADARIPVTSYALGIATDIQLLGALAVQSGGTVVTDAENLTGQEAGRRLTAAANTPVLWPSSVTWPAQLAEVFPKRLPPLRSDRETVVLGTLKSNAPLTIQVAADSGAGQQKLEFAVPAGTSADGNSFLATLVEQARTDGGVTLPLLGTASLAEARQAFASGISGLNRLAREALIAGNVASAKQLVSESLRRDPNDGEALALQDSVAKREKGGVVKLAARQAEAPAAEVIPPPPAPKGAPAAGGNGDLNLVGPPVEPPAGALTEGFERDRQVVRQQVDIDVRNVLNRARTVMGTDPNAASQILKELLERVRQVPELDPDVRDQYVDRIQSALMESARRRVEVEQIMQQRMESVTAARERLLAADTLIRNQDKVKQMMERYNALLSDGKFHTGEDVAAQAEQVAANTAVPIQAELFGRTLGYYRDIMAVRETRQKGVVDTLYQTELSHIPFPDNPPVVYPDPEWWQQMSIRRKEQWGAVDLAKQGNAERRINEALKSPTQLEFVDTPLSDVIDYLKDLHKIEIQVDTRALGEAGVDTSTPVTKNLKGISLRSALRLLLKEHGLTYLIRDEVLLITTPEEADNQLITKVYPVADLVIPIPPPGSMGSMGGMGMMGGGGMGGGMGGMGGMGGGMGGMGGGMGGMGGGGGMWNVPPEIFKKAMASGFQAFSVKDDLNVLDKSAASKAATTGKAAKTAVAPATDDRAAKIEIEIPKGANPETVWEQYFAKNKPQPKAVREQVRQLVNQQKFDHVIALIGAALRHQQAQPWMYEGLTLALDAAGRPKADVERALMSAVEFARTSPDLMYIGTYLARLGLNQRAVQLYRQAAAIDPMRPEPYMLGLNAARAANDLEGLKWASVGILGQAWPKEQAKVWQTGVGVAREVIDRLRKEKRTTEADAFQAGLDEALRRDCIVRVDYTGEGEVDLMVEEPGGTVCSLRNPRTTGGGIFLGDDVRQAGGDKFGGHGQDYVCPKSFNGKYRVLVRRVWGNITAGKVNVEVVNNFGTNGSLSVRKRIALDKDQALVEFEMKSGRRTEPLSQALVANAADGVLAMNRQIVAQQVAAAIDPQAMAGMAIARGANVVNADSTEGGSGGNINPLVPFLRGGAVGYQPVITVLPEGASMSAMAVISADRRYVRITSAPMFSGIAKVDTFNMASGSSTTGTGGTGGQGFGGLSGGGMF